MKPETHIRAEHDNSRSLCRLTKPNESLSYQHYRIGMSEEEDVVFVHDSSKTERVPVDRRAAIRDGIETLPNPVCRLCATEFYYLEAKKKFQVLNRQILDTSSS